MKLKELNIEEYRSQITYGLIIFLLVIVLLLGVILTHHTPSAPSTGNSNAVYGFSKSVLKNYTNVVEGYSVSVPPLYFFYKTNNSQSIAEFANIYSDTKTLGQYGYFPIISISCTVTSTSKNAKEWIAQNALNPNTTKIIQDNKDQNYNGNIYEQIQRQYIMLGTNWIEDSIITEGGKTCDIEDAAFIKSFDNKELQQYSVFLSTFKLNGTV